MGTKKIEGQELLITPGSLSEAFALKDAVARALIKSGIRLDFSGVDKDNAMNTPVEALGGILENALSVASDADVRDALFTCAKRCTYGKDRVQVDPEFFEPVENRGLYYPIMLEVLKENLGPFFGRLISKLGNLDLGKMLGNQK